MAQPIGVQNDSIFRTFVAKVAMGEGIRVKADTVAGQVDISVALNDAIGVTTAPAAVAGNVVVKLWQPTVLMVCDAGDVTVGEIAIHAVALGKVGDGGVDKVPFVALEASSADGDLVEFARTTGVAQETGVAVTTAGIHAALVNLGLITA